MSHATLLVVHGPNRGTRFSIREDDDEVVIGRSVGTRIRLDDSEVSRRHAAIVFRDGSFHVRDLRSANGIRINGKKLGETILKHGDSIRLGSTQMTFQLDERESRESVSSKHVALVDDSRADQHSAIVQQVRAETASSAAIWPDQKSGLELLYQVAEELVRPVHTTESLLQRILELTLYAVRADRGCVLLKEPVGNELSAIAFCRRDSRPDTNEQMPVSRSITNYVLRNGHAVRTSDAQHDSRFMGGNSIASSNICEAICAPMRGHEELLGVLYIDVTTRGSEDTALHYGQRLTDEHLKTVLAVARQSALAVESRRFQDAFLKAERFAAMGQTVAVLSHHVKNILQGIRGGSYLIQMGLDQTDEELIRQGWGIVDRNQTRIYELVMDMLSFTKDRVPRLELAELNDVCAEVAELGKARAEDCGVVFSYRPEPELPLAEFDREGIHRAVLNIVANGIDAVEGSDKGAVVLQTGYDHVNETMLVAVSDNGPGIPEDQRASVFNVFESSKGSRGTGIGLPVSRKILREHGGRIRIEGGPGEGTRFVLSWPRGNPEQAADLIGGKTILPGGSSVVRSEESSS